MVNNLHETAITSASFGVGVGLTMESLYIALIGAVAVGIVQPFFRVLWTKVLMKPIKAKIKKNRRALRKKRKVVQSKRRRKNKTKR